MAQSQFLRHQPAFSSNKVQNMAIYFPLNNDDEQESTIVKIIINNEWLNSIKDLLTIQNCSYIAFNQDMQGLEKIHKKIQFKIIDENNVDENMEMELFFPLSEYLSENNVELYEIKIGKQINESGKHTFLLNASFVYENEQGERSLFKNNKWKTIEF